MLISNPLKKLQTDSCEKVISENWHFLLKPNADEKVEKHFVKKVKIVVPLCVPYATIKS
jgi:hypothetical protein